MVSPSTTARPHTDIASTGWTASLPPHWRAYALLARLDRPIGIWLLFLPGLWGILAARAPAGRTVGLLALFAAGSVVMRAAGCVANDLWDRDIDRLVARTAHRPLASGALRPRQALVFLCGLLLAGLLVLLALPLRCWAMGAGILVLVALYPLAKRVTNWPQLVMGFTFGFGAPMGYAAAGGGFNVAMTALYGAAILWDLGFDTIYAHQDTRDDAVLGLGSTALLFGERTRGFLAVCYAAALTLLTAGGLRAGLHPRFIPALLPGAAALAWQVTALNVRQPALCLRLFRLNRKAGLLLGGGLLAGWF